MPAAHLRDDAKAAGMIAAFGNFQIRAVRRREPKARGIVIRDVGRTRSDKVELAQASSRCGDHALDDRAEFAAPDRAR